MGPWDFDSRGQNVLRMIFFYGWRLKFSNFYTERLNVSPG